MAREKSLDQSLLSNKDSKSNEPTLLDSQPLDGDGKEPPSALTATGDFDYRQSVAKSEEMNKEQEKYVKTNPFGLGSAVSSQEDADFRLLRTPVGYYFVCIIFGYGFSFGYLLFRNLKPHIPLLMRTTDNSQCLTVLRWHRRRHLFHI